MWNGLHRAKFTVVRCSGFTLGVGILSVMTQGGQNGSFSAAKDGWATREGMGWSWHCSGVMSHRGYHAWDGMQAFEAGEEIELELDLSARTLTAWKQGIQVGTLVPNIPCDTGFVWMCELYNEDDAVRLEAVRLPRPAAVDAT